MTKSTTALVFVAIIACSQRSFSEQLAPVTEFTLRDSNVDGLADQILSGPYGGVLGWVQRSSILVDETFIEFDVGLLTPGKRTTLAMRILSPPPGNGVLVARTFDVSSYIGTGTPDLFRFGMGDYLARLSVDTQPGPYQGTLQTVSLDVTSLVSAAIAGTNHLLFLGFRLHDTADVTPGSDLTPIVMYQGGSAVLSSVPEPSVLVLLGTGVASVSTCVVLRRGRKRDRSDIGSIGNGRKGLSSPCRVEKRAGALIDG